MSEYLGAYIMIAGVVLVVGIVTLLMADSPQRPSGAKPRGLTRADARAR